MKKLLLLPLIAIGLAAWFQQNKLTLRLQSGSEESE